MSDAVSRPEAGAVRTTRILAGLLVLVGFAATAWGRYADGPEVLCLWIGTIGCGLGFVVLMIHLVLKSRPARR